MLKPMKYIETLFLISVGLTSFSQDWNPLINGIKHNYESNFNNNIYTLWIDSSEVINNDTIHYLNRTLEVCDTCSNISEGVNCDSCYILDNQPQFLQKEMIDLGRGVMYFRGTSNFVILTQAKQLDSWIFDTINNISAQVINYKDSTFFNSIDSIKTIILSTNDTIILSRSFGILQFTYPFQSGLRYNLAGLQGTNFGLQIPDFSVIYDFNVGDVFQYEIKDYAEGNYYYWDEFKYKILSKQTKQDTFIYTIEGIIYRINWSDYPNPNDYLFHVSDVIKYYNNSEDFVNRYHHEKLKTEDDNCCFGYSDEESLYTYLDVFKSDSAINKKITSFNDNRYVRLFSTLNGYPVLLNIPLSPDGSPFEFLEYELVYKPYLGATKDICGDLWYFYSQILAGYIRSGDTIGYINSYPITDINVITQNDIIIYPNPTKGYLYFRLPDYFNKRAFYEVINMKGTTVMNGIISDTKAIDLSCLNKGLYILKIKSINNVIIKKIIKE